MSPKFNFKIESVLKQRKILEEREAKAFHALHQKLDRETEKLNSLKNKYKETQEKLTKKESEGIDITELKTFYTYLDSLKDDIKVQDLKVMEARGNLEKQRKILVKAQKDKKVIDKLKENKLDEHKELERIEEIKAIDDIVSVSEARKRRS